MTKVKYTAAFKEFWKLWPGRWRPEGGPVIKVGKYLAFIEWKRLDREEHEFIILKVLRSGRLKARGTQYLPDANRWLKRRGWEDFE